MKNERPFAAAWAGFWLSSVLVLGICTDAPSASPTWPQFRGPNGQGTVDADNLPVSWSESKNVQWKRPLPGKGYSSPVVSDDRIWLTTAIERKATPEEVKQFEENINPKYIGRRQYVGDVRLLALCVDYQTGKLERTIELFRVTRPEPIHLQNSYSSPTPVIDGNRLYCYFGTFGTACLDVETGKTIWKRKMPLAHSVGPGSSPIIDGPRLILVRDGIDRQYVTALDKATGKTIWKTDRPPIRATDGDRKKAYVTPLIVDDGERQQLIAPGAQWIVAYDPETGRELWRVDHGEGFSNVPRAVFGHGMVYVCTGFPRPQLWAIRTDGTGDVTKTHVAWKASRQIPKKPSPVLVGTEIYVVSDAGVATCFDALTGESLWVTRMPGNYSASPVAADGKIYFFSEEGKATVIRPARTYQELSQNHLPTGFMASPAIVQSALLLRTQQALYRIEKRE